MAKQYVHLSTEILEKSFKIKNGLIWGYLCSIDKPCTLEELCSHYNLSPKKITTALHGMMELNAVFSEIVDGKTLYRANPDTYYHSDAA